MSNDRNLSSLNYAAMEGVVPLGDPASLMPLLGKAPAADIHLMLLLQAWRDEPERVLAFFLRDNPHLQSEASHLLGIEIRADWKEAMVARARDEDSLAGWAVLRLAGVTLPSTAAQDFLDAVEHGQHGRALALLTFDYQRVVLGVGHCWADSYQRLTVEAGPGYLAGQLLIGAIYLWQRDDLDLHIDEVAASLDPNYSLSTRMNYLRGQAETFAAQLPSHPALQTLVYPRWQAYPAAEEEPEDEGELSLEALAAAYAEHIERLRRG